MPGEERIVIETLVNTERRGATLEVEYFEGAVLSELRFRTAANEEKSNAASLGKLRELASESGDAVRFMERVGKECDSWQRI